MKRVIFIAVIILLFALTSCSENSEKNMEIPVLVLSRTEESNQVSDESETPVILESNTKEISVIEFSSNIEYVKPYRTLEECIGNSQDLKAVIDSVSNEESSNTQNNVFIEDSTKLVFERTFKEDITYGDTFAEDTENALEEKRNEFVEIVNLFEWGINNNNITVVVRYKDTEGNIIFEKEFDNEE